MSQTYACAECGEKQPSVFQCFLHCFTNHLHADIGLIPHESSELLKHCFAYDPAYYQLVYGVLSKLPTWDQRN